ncbi:hypothetical protein GA0070616_4100 [Micromonospora nigra]|uniref:Uncharacterized protein n=1 Tax=Micromonospora nigra TaxID=145857 RepID=A0A1C6SM12_9ACTN|nr:hypothetical protein [Micromonospora nigra]SCL30571.1 hypothetical protein GA0070616_4100 [Micromonospora nigra]
MSAENRPGMRTPEQPSSLPAWMLDPPPPRRTLGRRLEAAVLAVPGARRVRHRWRNWQGRRRLHERFPTTYRIAAFFLSWAVALLLVLAFYALYTVR